MNSKYVVVEMQTNLDGTVSVLTDTFTTVEEAYNKYYTILAYAAISTLPAHSAALLTNKGMLIESKVFENALSEE